MSEPQPGAWHRRSLTLGASLLVIALAAIGGHAWYRQAQAGQQIAVDSNDPPVAPLMQLAAKALADGRLVAPQGSNLYEFYASVLQLEPANTLAIATLRDALPQALADIEDAIDKGDLDEAQREINLLHDYAPGNYTLLLLAGKLNQKRVVEARHHEAEAVAIRAREGLKAEGF